MHVEMAFQLNLYRHKHGGLICTNECGELAWSFALLDLVLRVHGYVVEPTNANSPSQNGAAEIYKGKLAVHTRTLVDKSGLLAKYWSATLLHLFYLHNHLVHTVTKKTTFGQFFATKPDIGHLKMFGLQVCVKRTGS
jgi:hypothetical protein